MREHRCMALLPPPLSLDNTLLTVAGVLGSKRALLEDGSSFSLRLAGEVQGEDTALSGEQGAEYCTISSSAVGERNTSIWIGGSSVKV
jgi:hypothetical protein